MDSEEHLVGCKTAGVVRCRTVRRRPIGEQFDQQMMLALRGTPWDAKGRLATPVPTMGGLLGDGVVYDLPSVAYDLPIVLYDLPKIGDS
eukprot:3584734-Amphidinium_carterae.1